MFVFDAAIRKNHFPLPPPQNRQRAKSHIGTKETSGEWEGDNFLVFSKNHLPHLLCKKVHMCPQLPMHESNELEMKF